ncbi:hypothetical protein EMIHUDRAFT_448936 [Emiliania huxleyi CCMP1516]|uniref:Uncharacterized protein n=2 Tax=Emiliania huxleyi TaxID=2903 RepID=A0A0D3KQE6_EMIH1|nr:hypothetical protein EMIHUDRAFT_448936 [Emiliania huxleyi CCMP1516]EOD37981.1 hypothetical protein EMIHUDRAFT_448936 [Emiliania huxleyi CCMP1516]|eukprot:XP_005790410.1 hypothetical protein EMIHUDRAFT_448936 [Emiliania huxleyi CCMP1516]
MSDVDAYAFLYYAQYVKYNERAASEAAGSPLVLSSVESMIFGRPARWGESINVVTFLCPPAACEEESGVVRLLHAWVADSSEDCSKPDVCNTSVMSYSKPPGAALAGLDVPRPGHPLYRPLMACLRENRTPTPQFARCEPLATSRQRELCVTVHPDAIGCGGRLQPSWAFDLFERQRTAIIGGQSALKYEDAFTFPKAQHGMPSPSSVMHGVASHRDAPPPKPLDLGVVRRVPEPQEPRRALPRRHSLG